MLNSSANTLVSGWNHLVQLFFPRLCEGCSKALLKQEKVLCISCTAQLPQTGYHNIQDNDTALRLAGRLPFEHASSFAYFTSEGILQHLLHELKYKDKQEVGVYLGEQFGYSLKDTDWVKSIDAIIPVPLHPKKELTRGYNQSQLIAEGLGTILSIPVLEHALYRKRHTESQTKKSRTERIDNMKDVFGVKNVSVLEHKHVLLVDDVLTTGATLEACALILQSVPGLKVSFGTVGVAMD